MTRHYSRHSGNKFIVLSFDRQTKVEEKPTGVCSERIYQCPQCLTSPAPLSAKQTLPNPENISAEEVFQKQHYSMPHVVPVRPQSRYLRALLEPGSTLFQPQLHLPAGRYTSAYIRKPADESDTIFSGQQSLICQFYFLFTIVMKELISCTEIPKFF
jgi:hypothetical protein